MSEMLEEVEDIDDIKARQDQLHEGLKGVRDISDARSRADLGIYYDQMLDYYSEVLTKAAEHSKIEKEDIIIPELDAGETSIVFQRHGKYDRNRDSETAGSVTPESAEELFAYEKNLFDDVFQQENVYVLFTSSDTQFAGKGFRSLETAEVAQKAAVESLQAAGLDPGERIINFNPNFSTARHDETDQDIRPLAGIREPQIFNPRDVDYITHLQEKHGYGDEEAKTGISGKAWAFHEFDGEKEVRETTGAEGEEELINRTKKTLAILERYARVWHANNPDKRLVIWAASHYDTISPIVKEVNGVARDKDGELADVLQAVDYGGGVVINVPASAENYTSLARRASKRVLKLGQEAATTPLEGKDIPSPTKLNQPRF